MSELKNKRTEAIKKVMRNWGIEHGDKCVMSLYDMASNLNNCWYAPLFITDKTVKKVHEFRGTQWSIDDYNLYKMFRAIRHGIQPPLELRKSYYNGAMFVLWKDYTSTR